MKKAMTTAFGILLVYALNAQITIDNSTFPAAGDTLYNSLDMDGSDLDLKSPGADVQWDFSSLTADSELNVIFKVASEGQSAADFPEADLVGIIPSAENERYVKVSASEVAEIGFAGLDPILRQLRLSTVYKSDYVIQVAPLNFMDMATYTSDLESKFIFDSLPQEIKDQLGAFRPDSFRVDIAVERTDEVDAWGSLKTPSGTFDVLRNKSIETRTTKVFAYTTIFGWADVTAQIKTILTDASVLDPIVSTVYTFLSNKHKEPIAAVTLDTNDVPAQVQFMGKTTVSTRDDQYQYASVKLSPNPTYGRTKMYFSGLKQGDYRLVVHDILGNELWSNDLTLSENGMVKEDFSFLKKGTYLYSLIDSKGVNVTTKRLIVLRP